MHHDNQFHWRPMVAEDVKAISNLASGIHVDFPESESVFREKLALFPSGCFTLANGELISGYLFSHPWKRYSPPPIDKFLGELPPSKDTYYIHDLAVAASARGHGMAEQIVAKIVQFAQSLDLLSVSLVAVGGSRCFWEHQKFTALDTPDLNEKLGTYGAQAYYMERSDF
ncbi:GNAT family N-acetyltransferase [Parasphingorhabdus sp. NYA22]